MYDLVLTKVRSDRPWPFKEMLQELSEALDGIDAALNNNKVFPVNDSKPTQDIDDGSSINFDRLFRRNRFIDLTVGLELFYQRALQGQRFTPQQTQKWRDWLAETRGAIETVDDGVISWPPPFSDETRRSWQQASSELSSRPEAMEDAYVGVALSLVLVGSADGDVSDRDCNAARSFVVKAEDNAPSYFSAGRLDADDKGTYKGFLEQVKIAVEGRCKS